MTESNTQAARLAKRDTTDEEPARLAKRDAGESGGTERPAARGTDPSGYERAYQERAFGVTDEVVAAARSAYARFTHLFTVTVLAVVAAAVSGTALSLGETAVGALVIAAAVIGGAYTARAGIRAAVAAYPVVRAEVRIALSE
ncbi:MAG: hypothetical protein ACI9CA_000038 [Natronomonas sp.]|jgi:hypothetical protein